MRFSHMTTEIIGESLNRFVAYSTNNFSFAIVVSYIYGSPPTNAFGSSTAINWIEISYGVTECLELPVD